MKRRARLAIKVWAALTVGFPRVQPRRGAALLTPVLFPAEWSAAQLQLHGVALAFRRDNAAGGLNDLVDLVFIAIAPVGVVLILGMMLRRFVRAIRRWWPTHRMITAALIVLLAGGLFVQGKTLVSRLVSEPRAPVIAATTGPTPNVQSPPAPLPATALPNAVVPPPSARSATTLVYVVQPGDTLWALAARRLGNPLRWHELFALNRGRHQGDGRAFVDPNLIYPGWTLQFPADATGVPTTGVPTTGVPTSGVASAPAPNVTTSASIGGGGPLTAIASSP